MQVQGDQAVQCKGPAKKLSKGGSRLEDAK